MMNIFYQFLYTYLQGNFKYIISLFRFIETGLYVTNFEGMFDNCNIDIENRPLFNRYKLINN